MKIISYNKQKNGMYKIKFENNFSIILHEDLILKYNLLLNKYIDDEKLEELYEENKTYEVYNIALKYINVKLRSVYELRKYLDKKKYSTLLIDNTISILKKQGYLNDEVYVNAYINDQINLTLNGPFKVKKSLLDVNIELDLIDKYIPKFSQELIDFRINKLINKYLNSKTNKSAYALKQKIIINLVNMGYSKEDIVNNLENIQIVDNADIRKKEYDKIYNKLSKKYSGSELEYRVRQKMYQKGFNYTDT